VTDLPRPICLLAICLLDYQQSLPPPTAVTLPAAVSKPASPEPEAKWSAITGMLRSIPVSQTWISRNQRFNTQPGLLIRTSRQFCLYLQFVLCLKKVNINKGS